MKISVVIPTIGREKYLELALDSLVNQITPFDEIVVFDNSIEQNINIELDSKNDSIISIVRSGVHVDPISSWNKAVLSCKSEYVAILGDDDVASNKFSTELRKSLEVSDVVIARAKAIDENGKKISDLPYPENKSLDYCSFFNSRVTGNCSLFVPGIAFSKKIFNQVNGFHDTNIEGYAFADELLLLSMCFYSSNIAITNTVCWDYRVHSEQIGGVKSIENLIALSDKYINLFETKLTYLGFESDNGLFCKHNRKKYLTRVIRYNLVGFSKFASLKYSFKDFQNKIIKQLYRSNQINMGVALKLHILATRIYISNTKIGCIIKNTFKK